MKRLAFAIVSAAALVACVTPAPEPAPPPAYQPAPAAPPPASPPPTIPQPLPAEQSDQNAGSAQLCSQQAPACPAGSFCQFPLGDSCGEGGTNGVCEPVPQVCNRMYAPVCGCDGKTRSNSCTAAAQATNIRSKGACKDTASKTSCGGIMGKICPSGFSCADDTNDSCDPKNGGRDCMGICVGKATKCEPVRCKMYCKNGWQVGPDGCERCACVK
jgi:hypothetical protein